MTAEAAASGTPPANLFAGADPIEDENLGNFGEYFDAPTTPDGTPPVGAPTVADTASNTGTPPVEGAVPEPAPAVAAPEDTAEGGEPVVDPQSAEPAPASAADPAITPPTEPVEGESGAEGAEPQETSVPSYRLAQEAARRRQAEAYAKDMERQLQDAQQQVQQQAQPQVPQVPAQQPAPPAPTALDLGDDPKQMFDKVLDGDLDSATALFTDMMSKATAAQQAPAAQQDVPTPEDVQTVVERKMQAMELRNAEITIIEGLEQRYEVFDPSSGNFNKDLVDETLALKATYEKMHFTPADAMERASTMVLNMNGIATAIPTAPLNPAAAPDPAAVKRNVDALNATPPQMPAGEQQRGQPEIDINSLSQEEFEALPEATIARMRGDTL